jgi:membrane protein YdbS with pleckstrin-like domain
MPEELALAHRSTHTHQNKLSGPRGVVARFAGDEFMSTHEHSQDDAMPRLEPWLRVMASSIVPVMLALYVHARFWMPLVGTTVVLFVASLVMLRRQVVRHRRMRQTVPPRRELEAS